MTRLTFPHLSPSPPPASSNGNASNNSRNNEQEPPPRKRLKENNKKASTNLELRPTIGDGNCLFRAVSTQVFGDEDWHDRVRAECTDFIQKDRRHFKEFISEDFDEYVKRKQKLGCF